jgi:hypothetical protein
MDGFPSYSWNQSPLDCFFGYEPNGPVSAALWRITANHCDNALLVRIVQGWTAHTLSMRQNISA